MAKYGWKERRLFYVEDIALENLAGTPAVDADAGQMLAYIKVDHLYIKKPSVSEVLIVEDGLNLGAGANLFTTKSASAQLQFRSLVSTDGTVNITQNADDINLEVDLTDINDELDHGTLLGLADDDHTQYLLLAGRSGGQIAEGGTDASDDLELKSTDNATKGAVKIIDGSEFLHNDMHRQRYILQTTDATPASLATIGLTDDRVYNVHVTVVARRSDIGGESRASWKLTTTAYRAAAGGATLQGSVKQDYKTSATASLDADIDTSTNDIRVRVTGKAAEDYEWKAYVEYLESD